MIANHIHDALAQVRTMQQVILEKRLFRGYSGTARIIGGFVALAGTIILASACVPKDDMAHLTGWAIVLSLGMLSNYGALGIWFLSDRDTKREFMKLMPALDAIPPLGIGAILSLALVIHNEFSLLFGVWMSLYGVAHFAYRLSLPASNYLVGIYYVIAGSVCFLWPGLEFTNPWPMGIIFFAGETAGGIILHRHRLRLQRDRTGAAQ